MTDLPRYSVLCGSQALVEIAPLVADKLRKQEETRILSGFTALFRTISSYS